MSGWKENSNFYGACETYMVKLTSRERSLLHWHERSVRGLSPLYAEDLDNEESSDDPPFSSEMTEEDFLFPVDPPTFMIDLSQSLDTSSRPPLSHCIRDEFFCRTKTTNLSETLTLTRECIFAQPKYIRLLSRLLSYPLCSQNRSMSSDYDLFLDYIPLLRCMAVQERVSEYMFKLQTSSNDASSRANNGRRTTRRSLKRGREQYFDKIVPSHAFEGSMQTAQEIVELLANTSLLYER